MLSRTLARSCSFMDADELNQIKADHEFLTGLIADQGWQSPEAGTRCDPSLAKS